MINQVISRDIFSSEKTVHINASSMEDRLGIGPADGTAANSHVSQLYGSLKAWWTKQTSVDGAQVIRQLQQFTADDGSRPYLNIVSHTAVLTQLMQLLKDEGGAASRPYAALSDGLCLAVVSNGFYNQFMSKMMEQPEKPEVW